MSHNYVNHTTFTQLTRQKGKTEEDKSIKDKKSRTEKIEEKVRQAVKEND